jgi:hypothetical protein
MIVKIMKTKGGQWLGELQDHPFDEPTACWAGSPEKVKNAHLWQILKYQGMSLEFDIRDEVWEDTTHLLPTDEEARAMG